MKNKLFRYLFFLLFILISGCEHSKKDFYKEKDTTNRASLQTTSLLKGGINFSAQQIQVEDLINKGSNLGIKHSDSTNIGEKVYQIRFQHLYGDDLLKEKYTKLSYSESVQYLSSAIASDFFVITSNRDTIMSSGVIFERNFKIAPHKLLLVFFSGIDQTEVDLLYNDRLFGNGPILFNKNNLKL